MQDAPSSIRRGAFGWLAKTRLPRRDGGSQPRDLGSSRTALVFPMLPCLPLGHGIWHGSVRYARTSKIDDHMRQTRSMGALIGINRGERHVTAYRQQPPCGGRYLGRIWAQKGSNPVAGGLIAPQLRRHLDGGVAASRDIRGSSRAPLLMGPWPLAPYPTTASSPHPHACLLRFPISLLRLSLEPAVWSWPRFPPRRLHNCSACRW
jgi:hypothetical protein